MDLFILCVAIMLFIIGLIPNNEKPVIKDNKNYKLTHCDIHKWIIKSNGFDEDSGFESTYSVCETCGFFPGTDKYE
jgi:hypothetical protein